MSIRYFCDACGHELNDAAGGDLVSNRAITQPGQPKIMVAGRPILIELILGTETTWNEGQLCLDCVKWAVDQLLDRLDKRPQPEEARRGD